jgi:hypothetical protein
MISRILKGWDILIGYRARRSITNMDKEKDA